MNQPAMCPEVITKPFGLQELTARALTPEEAVGLADMSRGIGAQAREFLREVPSSSDPLPTFTDSLAKARAARGELFVVGAFSGAPSGVERLIGLTVGNTFERNAVISGERDRYTFGRLRLVAVARDARKKGVAGAMLDSAYQGYDLAGFVAREPYRFGRDISAQTFREIARRSGVALIR